MSRLVIDHEKCTGCGVCESVCPFDGIKIGSDGKMTVTASCRLCGLCVKNCPVKALYIEQTGPAKELDRSRYRDVLVFAEQREGRVQDITFELIGKARELAGKLGHEVHCILAGHNVTPQARALLTYGVDKVYVYDHPALEHFRIEPYTSAVVDVVEKTNPNILLIGATFVGRSLAPRVATRLRTGLTADCTILDVRENGDLIQTRPAFGGNVMARILTPNHRPQMATVRYKVMERAEPVSEATGEIIPCNLPEEKYRSLIEVLQIEKKPQTDSLTDADIIVCGGRGFQKEEDLKLLYSLADVLGAAVATTRPLIEAGWASYDRQVGLSGRTVRPKLFVAVGVSGAIQLVAGMRSSETIIAINKDKNAPIFDVAHYAVVGDLYDIVPNLISLLQREQKEAV